MKSSSHPDSAVVTADSRGGAADPKECRVAILGFGTVGSSVARILSERRSAGLHLTHIFNRNVGRKKVDWLPAPVQWTAEINDVLSSDVDVVVELTGGLLPAGDWIRG